MKGTTRSRMQTNWIQFGVDWVQVKCLENVHNVIWSETLTSKYYVNSSRVLLTTSSSSLIWFFFCARCVHSQCEICQTVDRRRLKSNGSAQTATTTTEANFKCRKPINRIVFMFNARSIDRWIAETQTRREKRKTTTKINDVKVVPWVNSIRSRRENRKQRISHKMWRTSQDNSFIKCRSLVVIAFFSHSLVYLCISQSSLSFSQIDLFSIQIQSHKCNEDIPVVRIFRAFRWFIFECEKLIAIDWLITIVSFRHFL